MIRSVLVTTTLGLLSSSFALSNQAGNGVALVRSGTSAAVVLVDSAEFPVLPPVTLSEEPKIASKKEKRKGELPPRQDAVVELVSKIHAITGAELPVQSIALGELSATLKKNQAAGKNSILLGGLALAHLGKLPPEKKEAQALKDPSGFVLSAKSGVVAIAGSTEVATRIGVYELLEQFGVRWFFPGKLGTVIPSTSMLEVKLQETAQKPTFPDRQFQFNGFNEWAKYQREGGARFVNAHGIPLGEDGTFDAHPEFFSLVGGVRVKRQHCLSNPEVLRRATEEVRKFFRENPESPWIGLGPKDGRGFCECEKCLALDGGDWDPFASETSRTDRYIWFFNRILDGIHDEFPDKKIAFYIYAAYMRPPMKEMPNKRIVGAFAPISFCRIHGMSNPICPERGYLPGVIEGWSKLLPETYERGYWFNLADPGMLFVQTDRLHDEISHYAKNQIRGFRTECVGHWATEGPSLYIAGKLMWNVNTDPAVIQNEFCEMLFGPAAAKPMNDYFSRINQRLKTADHHTGSAFNLLQLYPSEIRKDLKGLITKAQELATEPVQKERVEIFALGLEYTDTFARMIEARNRQDWTEAHFHLGQMDRLRERLVSYDKPMLSAKASINYLKRFFRLPVEQGYARTTGNNQMITPLRDEWEFLIDPQEVGSDLHYERPQLTGGNWQKAPTYSTTWTDLGLRYYKGLAWFRQTVDIPQVFDGKRVFLWMGGVDETARIWVNGELVGTSPISAFTPFELDATKAMRPGKNTVVVCVANKKVDELGTGGITAPAFFYHPEKGDAAILENARPLRETFP